MHTGMNSRKTDGFAILRNIDGFAYLRLKCGGFFGTETFFAAGSRTIVLVR
jgi:hypothetical protein